MFTAVHDLAQVGQDHVRLPVPSSCTAMRLLLAMQACNGA
jgi:hypothetical protein